MTFRYIAWQNVRRQWRDFASYLVATAFSAMVFFVFVSLYYHPQFNEMTASNTRLQALFLVSAVLVGLFSLLFLWYSSSLFFQRRHREVGTYMLMGMKKREAAAILYLESIFVGLVALAIGVAFGLVLRRLFLLLLVRLMRIPMELEIQTDLQPVVVTAVTFAALLAVGGIAGVWGVLRYQLVRLFTDEQTGEDRPRFVAVQTVLGIAAIATGYALALMTEGYVHLQGLLWILIVTIAGTFLIFGGGGYLLARAAKRRAGSAADPRALVATGQLVFRIRRNAKFLALVAVLNAVAVTSVGTFLTLREERERMFETIPEMTPFDFSFFADSEEVVDDLTARLARQEPTQQPQGAFVRVLLPDGGLRFSERATVDGIIGESDYDRLAEMRGLRPVELGRDDALALVAPVDADGVAGRTVERPDGAGVLEITTIVDARLFSRDRVPGGYTGVVTDETYRRITSARAGVGEIGVGVIEVADPAGSFDLLATLDEALDAEADLIGYVAVVSTINGFTGVLLFIGAFIGIMLILSNGSIIFFRQLMEAGESRGRFELLETLGFSRTDIRRTILRGQIALFGAPFAVGLLHALFALVMLSRIVDIPTLYAHVAISAVYALVYAGYLAVNARAYERIVLPS